MHFLDVKLGVLLCFLNGFGIAVFETFNTAINCIIAVPDCGLLNGTKLSNDMNNS